MENTEDAIFKDGNQTAIYARKLHERSFLLFEYFGADGEVTRAHMPFLQNITINEDGKANLASYNLIGRAGQLFAYNGADSRRIKLDFEINLLHLFHIQQSEGFTNRMVSLIKNTDRRQEMRRFTQSSKPMGFAGAPYAYAANQSINFEDLLGEDTKRILASRSDTAVRYGQRNPDVIADPNTSNDTLKTLDLVMYWVNLIRSSVLNNSKNTIYGPPIVRLNHGAMYMNSPCLVEDYKISVDKSSNYDVDTLLPHTVKVSLSLVESRSGNFGNYVKGESGGDNITGWESILDENVIDSMNYNFKDFFEDEE